MTNDLNDQLTYIIMAHLSLLSLLWLTLSFNSNKSNTPICNVRGTYTGTSKASKGIATGTMTYILKDNNFAVGRIEPNGADVTFGSYTTSCSITSECHIRTIRYNFAVGRIEPNGADVTFGSYTATCSSIKLTVYYTENNSYYILKGKFSNNMKRIKGT